MKRLLQNALLLLVGAALALLLFARALDWAGGMERQAMQPYMHHEESEGKPR